MNDRTPREFPLTGGPAADAAIGWGGGERRVACPHCQSEQVGWYPSGRLVSCPTCCRRWTVPGLVSPIGVSGGDTPLSLPAIWYGPGGWTTTPAR